MTNRLAGKVALVTGAGSGIGRAVALAFAADGAAVVVSDVSVAGGTETVARITAAGGRASFVACDVTDEAQVQALVASAVKTYGRLDFANNNAGIEGPLSPIPQFEAAAWSQVLAVNLTGVFLCLKHEIPAILAQGTGGAIVNTASLAGLVAAPLSAAYTASKHGVVGLTKVAALELARTGVRVNAVCPAFVLTPMVERTAEKVPELKSRLANNQPMGRLGTPEEIADAVVWLCSPQATFLTGVALPLDGGATAR